MRGIFIHNEATAYIKDCDIFGNDANLTLRRCTIKNNFEAVWVSDKEQGTIEYCDLRDNKLGAWDIDGTSQVQRPNNKITALSKF